MEHAMAQRLSRAGTGSQAHAARAEDSHIASLTARIARGDREALGAFYEAWFDRACAIAQALTRRDEAFCLDVVQDAMIRVARSITRIETEAQLQRWMMRTIHTAAIDRLRAESRRIARERRYTSADNHAVDDALNAQVQSLREHLAQLDPDDRALIDLRCVRSHTRDQIARAVGMSPGAVHGRVRRTLARLRARMQEEHDNEQP